MVEKQEERVVNKLQRRRKSWFGTEAKNNNTLCDESGSVRKRKTLQELHMEPPPGFRKFEAEVDWKTIDEEIALQLWEDVFKPLYTF